MEMVYCVAPGERDGGHAPLYVKSLEGGTIFTLDRIVTPLDYSLMYPQILFILVCLIK